MGFGPLSSMGSSLQCLGPPPNQRLCLCTFHLPLRLGQLTPKLM